MTVAAAGKTAIIAVFVLRRLQQAWYPTFGAPRKRTDAASGPRQPPPGDNPYRLDQHPIHGHRVVDVTTIRGHRLVDATTIPPARVTPGGRSLPARSVRHTDSWMLRPSRLRKSPLGDDPCPLGRYATPIRGCYDHPACVSHPWGTIPARSVGMPSMATDSRPLRHPAFASGTSPKG